VLKVIGCRVLNCGLDLIRLKNSKPYIIGVAGGSASGKTYLLRSLREIFPQEEVCIISQDNYYHTAEKQQLDERGFINFDLPEAIDAAEFLEDLKKLRKGIAIQRQEYMFNQPGLVGELLTLKPAPVIVAEGIFTFHFREVFDVLDLKVFLDCREDIKLRRRLERDTRERGVPEETTLYQWHNHVCPGQERYLIPYRDEADVILTNNEGFGKGLELLADHIHAILAS
jgi:uridine kinase